MVAGGNLHTLVCSAYVPILGLAWLAGPGFVVNIKPNLMSKYKADRNFFLNLVYFIQHSLRTGLFKLSCQCFIRTYQQALFLNHLDPPRCIPHMPFDILVGRSRQSSCTRCLI
jgi:hypothetical protein